MVNEDISQFEEETFELMMKAARRVVYDLDHCVSLLEESELKGVYKERCSRWKTIFEGGTGVKDYKHRLHQENRNLYLFQKQVCDISEQHSGGDISDNVFIQKVSTLSDKVKQPF